MCTWYTSPRTGNGSPRIPCFLEFWQCVPGTGCVVLEIDPGEIRDPYPSRRNKNSVEALCVSTEFSSERCFCCLSLGVLHHKDKDFPPHIHSKYLLFEEPEGGLNLQEEVVQDPRPRNTPTKTKIGGQFRQDRIPSSVGF